MSAREALGLYGFYGGVFLLLAGIGGQALLSRLISRRVRDRHPQAWQVATRGFREARIDTRTMSYEQDVSGLGDPTLSLMCRLRLGLRILAALTIVGGLAWVALDLGPS